jgi:peroxiredoxin Q/BCP
MMNILCFVFSFFLSASVWAELKIGQLAPEFKTQTHEGKEFNLSQQKGKWTILYFYPKADTPGCTKQACAFRDSIKVITNLGAEVYGVSADEVKDLQAFHKKHSLNFTLLADPKANIIKSYGTKMMGLDMSKRWTFIISPELKIQYIDTNVDPVKDAENTASIIKKLKEKSI